MGTIYTVEGNTSGGSTLVANGGCVAKKSYSDTYNRIAVIWRPKYVEDEAFQVTKTALKYVGYLEKKSNANLEDFTANAGTNNFNRFAAYANKMTGSSVYTNGVAWCDQFVDAVMIEALGVKRAKELLHDWSAYTPTSSNYLKTAGATQVTASNAKYGDIIFFKNSTRICHTGYVTTGMQGVVNSNTSSSTYSHEQFIKDVESILDVSTTQAAFNKSITLSTKSNNTHALVLPVQKYLKLLGYYTKVCDRDYGDGTKKAVTQYQKEVVKATTKNCDGIISAKGATWKKLLEI